MFSPDKYTLMGQVISNKMIINNYCRAFKELLKDAIPASFIIQHMDEYKKKFLDKIRHKMTKAEVLWLQCLVDYGIHCKFSEFKDKQLAIATEHAVQEDLVEVVERNGESLTLPKYCESISKIRSLWLSKS